MKKITYTLLLLIQNVFSMEQPTFVTPQQAIPGINHYFTTTIRDFIEKNNNTSITEANLTQEITILNNSLQRTQCDFFNASVNEYVEQTEATHNALLYQESKDASAYLKLRIDLLSKLFHQTQQLHNPQINDLHDDKTHIIDATQAGCTFYAIGCIAQGTGGIMSLPFLSKAVCLPIAGLSASSFGCALVALASILCCNTVLADNLVSKFIEPEHISDLNNKLEKMNLALTQLEGIPTDPFD